MVDAVWEHLLPGSRHRHGDPGRRSPLPGLVAVLRWAMRSSRWYCWAGSGERGAYLVSSIPAALALGR